MAKVKIFRYLLILLLIPSLLTSAEITQAQLPDPSSSPTSTTTPESSNSTEPSTPTPTPLSSNFEFKALDNQVKALQEDGKQLKEEINTLKFELNKSQQEERKKLEQKNKDFKEQLDTLQKEINRITKTKIQLSSISEFQKLAQKVKQLEQDNNQLTVLFIVSLILIIFQCGLFTYFYFYEKTKKERKNKRDSYLAIQKTLKTIPQSSSYNLDEENENNFNILCEQLYKKLLQEFFIQITTIQNRLDQLEKEGGFDFDSSRPSYANKYFIPQELLVEIYNKNPILLEKFALAKVSETENSINNRGSSQKVILEPAKRGNYWIIKDGEIDYMIPKIKFRINEHSYSNVKVLFECLDYKPGGSNNFQLVKPARLSYLSGEDKWQLKELGILQFY